jgi:hypothetical protein
MGRAKEQCGQLSVFEVRREGGKFCRGGINCRARDAPEWQETGILSAFSAWHGAC